MDGKGHGVGRNVREGALHVILLERISKTLCLKKSLDGKFSFFATSEVHLADFAVNCANFHGVQVLAVLVDEAIKVRLG